MGYYASYDGYFIFKDTPTKEAMNAISNLFENFDSETNSLRVNVNGNNKYYEDIITDGLELLAPFIEAGEIKYEGEDNVCWRFIFKRGEWIEEMGKVYYESDIPQKVRKHEIPDFLEQIVDIFEYSIDSDELVFVGKLYDTVIRKLDKMMKRWSIYN